MEPRREMGRPGTKKGYVKKLPMQSITRSVTGKETVLPRCDIVAVMLMGAAADASRWAGEAVKVTLVAAVQLELGG